MNLYFHDVPIQNADFHSYVKLVKGGYQTSGMLTNEWSTGGIWSRKVGDKVSDIWMTPDKTRICPLLEPRKNTMTA